MKAPILPGPSGELAPRQTVRAAMPNEKPPDKGGARL
jgi:hypothetical protein